MENIDKTPGLQPDKGLKAHKEVKDMELDPGGIEEVKGNKEKKVPEVQERMEIDQMSDKIDPVVEGVKGEKNIEDTKEMDVDPGSSEGKPKSEDGIQVENTEDVVKMDEDPVSTESNQKAENKKDKHREKRKRDLVREESSEVKGKELLDSVVFESAKGLESRSSKKNANPEEVKNETENKLNKIEEEKKEDQPNPTNPEPESSNADVGGAYYISQHSSLTYSEKNVYIRENPEAKLAVQFNYEFNNKQKLVDIDTKDPFTFTNQSEYEKLGKVVQNCIESMMTHKYGLIRVSIPEETEKSPKSYIYKSPNFNNPEQQHPRALLLIQGAGAVRPGIWARSVCINDTLKTGSMNSFLSFANKHQFEVIIFNPNKTRSKGKEIPKNNSLEQHGKYVWERFIRNSSPHDLYIVAHSCGGLSTMSLMELFWSEFKERVKGIAFTDAVHGYHGMKKEKMEFCRRRAVDWVASHRPLDTVESKKRDEIVFLSSGHHKHEYTTGFARKSIKKFLLQINEKNPYL